MATEFRKKVDRVCAALCRRLGGRKVVARCVFDMDAFDFVTSRGIVRVGSMSIIHMTPNKVAKRARWRLLEEATVLTPGRRVG